VYKRRYNTKLFCLYGTDATVLNVPTPRFGTVVTLKMAGSVPYRSYVLHNRCDDCEHCSQVVLALQSLQHSPKERINEHMMARGTSEVAVHRIYIR
jgi:hypothetical protein